MMVARPSVRGGWHCYHCPGVYTSLKCLVGHSRSTHPHSEVKCNIKGCRWVTKTADSWYRHVRSEHAQEYDHDFEIQSSEDVHSYSDASDDMDCGSVLGDNEDSIPESDPEPDLSAPSTEVACEKSCNEIIAMTLNLKDRHRMSQSALDDVINILYLEHVTM